VSLFRRERLGLGIAAGRLACCNGLGAVTTRPFDFEFGVSKVEVTQDFHSSLRALLDDGAICSSPKRRAVVRAVVSSEIARHWIVEPPPGVSSLSELRLVAAARFGQIFGSSADAWAITGDWRVHRAFVCAAIPRWLTDGLESACRDLGARYDTSTTLGRVLHRHRRRFADGGWNCIRTPRSLAVLRLQGHLPVSMRLSLRDSSANLPSALADGAAELRREALRRGEDLTAPVNWFDLTTPAHTDRNVLDATVASVAYRVTHLRGSGTPLDAASSSEASVAAYLGLEDGGVKP